jgi:hypothetical protein
MGKAAEVFDAVEVCDLDQVEAGATKAEGVYYRWLPNQNLTQRILSSVELRILRKQR